VGVADEVLTVSVDEPVPPVMVPGLNAAEAPAGKPVMLSATSPVKPATGVRPMAYLALPPEATETCFGLMEPVKPVTAGTTEPSEITMLAPFPPVAANRIELASRGPIEAPEVVPQKFTLVQNGPPE
jgi:hypothetical protein